MARPPAALFLSLLLASCQTPDFAVDAGYMIMELAGNIGFDASGGGGSFGINLGQGLDISDADSPYAKVEFSVLGLRIGISGFKYSDSGDSTLDASFGDISAGSTVQTDVDMLNVKGTIAYDLVSLDFLRISPGISVDYFDIDMKMVASSPIAAFEELDFKAPVPMPYISAAMWYGDFILDAELSAISVDLQDVDGVYFDLSTKLHYKPLPLIDVFVGYRYLLIDADGEADGQDFDADVHMNGLFFGGRIGF